jgi:uncharacterized RDD family membrane protein YckC
MTDPTPVQAPAEGRPGVDAVAGLLAAAGIFLGLVAIAYHPARVAPAAILAGLVAAGMSGRWQRLSAVAVAVGALGWLAGMAIAVVTNHPLW